MLYESLSIAEGELHNYIQGAAEQVARAADILPAEAVAAFLLVGNEGGEKRTVHWQDISKLEDGAFRQLAAEMRECRYRKDRLKMVRALPSLADWVDILDAEVLQPGDATELFGTMKREELGLLLNYLPLWSEKQQDVSDFEKPWQQELRQYMAGITEEERRKIQMIRESIRR